MQSINWPRITYILACVVVPVAWGLFVVWASNRVEQRVRQRAKAHGHDEETAARAPLEYHI